ncbi:DUF1631 family protein [Lysobacter sp. A03]|uniref:DUF1631 family protein n=1 Tax=Lysobacter sp. A03 TaxID=1199154 RepID=UPI0005B6F41E|nr:DUF1631 family protein [Lysobacter sp. A03]KIQ97806.1 Thymidine phosphorylase [Lysobacter sp. A03]
MSYLDASLPRPRPANTAAAFPARVRAIIGRLQALAGDELERELVRLLDTLEQDLFRQAEKARSAGAQSGYLASLGTLRAHRHKLIASFSAELAAALENLRAPVLTEPSANMDPDASGLRLVDHSEVTEANVLTAIARRHESRAGLPLLLLGQRLAVLAGRPAFDVSTLPVGPTAVATMLSRACTGVTGDVEARLQLYSLFDQQMMAGYLPLVEAMNTLLDRENVLPGLTFVPTLTRREHRERSGQAPDSEAGQDDGGSTELNPNDERGPSSFDATSSRRRRTDGHAIPSEQGPHGFVRQDSGLGGRVDTADEMQALAQLQQLLAATRHAGSSGGNLRSEDTLATDELDAALSSLQAPAEGASMPRSPGQVRQALLEQSRQQRGRATHLADHDDETFELLGLLYSEIGRELRQGTRGAALLERLQVPLLRVALQDRGFFVRKQHPARQLLNSIAEAGTQWLDDNDPGADRRLDDQLHEAVNHVVQNYNGDPGVFAAAQETLSGQLEALARKAEVAQRRQVEAARGRDKLERAKQQAALAIKDAIGDTAVPRFLTTLLEQAWTDVLSLVLLRHGEESAEWRGHVDAPAPVIAANRGEPAPESLQPRGTEALGLVGYQGDEADAIAGRLVAANDDGDDPASRTELAVKLKARARLGANEIPPLPPVGPRNAREEECYVHLRSVAFGTSIEFNINQQGDRVRHRLAWFSPITGRVLLLTAKGQRIEDQQGRETLDQIARLLAIGEARIVPADDHTSLVDRAWQSTLAKLRSFVRNPPGKEISQ